MSRFGITSFDRVEDIPDPVTEELLLPPDEPTLWAPTAPELSSIAGLPAVEMAYIYLDEQYTRKPGGSNFVESIMLNEPDELHSLMRGYRMSHVTRAIARVILHPLRHQIFDLALVYDAEIKRNARFPDVKNERPFFAGFIENWGVLKRD